MKQDDVFTDFSAGQLSQKFRGRFDLDIYHKGLAKVSNFIPGIPAGIAFRPGTRRIGSPSAACVQFAWIISYDIAYLLEVTTTGIRFWRNDAYTGTSITFTTAITADDLASIQIAQSPKRLYMTLGTGNWAPKVLTYTGVDTFTWGDLPIMGNTGKVPFQSSGNYPKCLTIHESRLYFGNTANEPQKIWASRPGIFFYEPWEDETEYEVGDYITAVDSTKLAIYQCTVAGESGTTEPTWPSSGTVVDGEVTWTYYADYLVDFCEYDQLISTATETRESSRTFQGDLTTGSNTITGIDADILEDMHVGDRVWGNGIPTRDEMSFTGAVLKNGPYVFSLSSYYLNLLYEGEYIAGDHLSSESIINDIATSLVVGSVTLYNVLTLNKNADSQASNTGTSIAAYVGEIAAFVTAIDKSAGTLTFECRVLFENYPDVVLSLSATKTASDVFLASGWNDPLVTETEEVTTKRKVVEDSNAFSFLISSEQCDEILWFSSGRNLVVGTVSGERIIPAGTTALSVQCPKHTSYGSARIQPISIGETCLFVESTLQGVREYIYSQEQDGYYSPPLSMIAEGIFTGSVIKVDFQTAPIPIAWFLQDNGILIGCVYSKTMGITAWFSLETDGTIESIAVVPRSGVDTLYLSVLRHGVRTFERMLPIGTTGEHLDASTTATVASGQVTGLAWLASQDVRVYYSGAAYDVTVSAGGVATMPAAIPDGASVLIGYGFTGVFTTMPSNPANQIGPQYQKAKTVYSLIARILNSYPFKVGRAEDKTLETAKFTGPVSGDYRVLVNGSYDSDGSVTIVQDEPLDLEILAITAQVSAGG